MSNEHVSPAAPRRLHPVLRWTTRIAALISLGLIAAAIVARRENPFQMRGTDLLLFGCFPAAAALGLILGWRWELAGGILAVGGWLGFLAVNLSLFGVLPRDWDFLAATAPAFLLLFTGVWSRFKTRRPGLAPERAA